MSSAFKSDAEVMAWLFLQLEQVSKIIRSGGERALQDWRENYGKNVKPNYEQYLRQTSQGESVGEPYVTKPEFEEPYVTREELEVRKCLQFDDYVKATRETAIYPEVGTGYVPALTYCVLGLVGEAGEIANKVKKILRGDFDSADNYEEHIDAIRKEIGDTTWYLARLCDELNFSWALIADENLTKLRDRKARGVIKGSGDTR